MFSHVWRFSILRSRVGGSQLEEIDSNTEFGGVVEQSFLKSQLRK